MTAGEGAAVYGRWVQDRVRRWFARVVLLILPVGGLTSLFFIHCDTRVEPVQHVTNVGFVVILSLAWFVGIVGACLIAAVLAIYVIPESIKWLWREAFHQNDHKRGWWS